MRPRAIIVSAALAIGLLSLAMHPGPQQTVSGAVVSEPQAGPVQLSLPGGDPFRHTELDVQALRTIAVSGSATLAVTWNEVDADGRATPWFALSEDGGRTFPRGYPSAAAAGSPT